MKRLRLSPPARRWSRLLPWLVVGTCLLAAPPARAGGSDASRESIYEQSDAGPRRSGTGNMVAGFVGLSVLFCVLLYLVPSRAIAASNRRLEQTVRARVLTLQEEDRRRIARELHDGAGQALTAARLQLMALRDANGASATVDPIIKCIDEAMDEVRRSTTSLSPPVLAELGLGPAIARHCDTFSMGSNLTVRCDLPDALPLLEAHVEIAVYRIVQEALHNAARHAGATEAWVRLKTGTTLEIEIGDNGVGLVPGAGQGFGLGSIRERAALLGGKVVVFAGSGPGCRLMVSLPLDGSRA